MSNELIFGMPHEQFDGMLGIAMLSVGAPPNPASVGGSVLFHGTEAQDVIGIIKSGGFIPVRGKVFSSEGLGDALKYGADLTTGETYVIEVVVDTSSAIRTSRPGVTRAVILEGETLVPAELRRLFVRTSNEAGEFTTEVVEGAEAIAKYFGL